MNNPENYGLFYYISNNFFINVVFALLLQWLCRVLTNTKLPGHNTNETSVYLFMQLSCVMRDNMFIGRDFYFFCLFNV